MCPKITESHRHDLRQRLIDIALTSFSKYGYDKTRMEDIATTADVAKGTLYLYFKNKEDLFTAISERNIEKLKNHFITIFNNKEELISGLETFYKQFKNPDNKVFFEIVAESSRNSKLRQLLYEHRKKIIEMIIKYVDLQKSKGFLKKDLQSKTIAYILVAQYDGLRINRILGMNDEENNRVWIELIKKLFY
ncbi:MAG: TetR/AcrR family transcriptional regulator [Nitrososphaeraceae archaeon]|nr:TetR/AcrR family transcriptional regulator [Nitrososphaeraceae archaeon]